MRGGRCSVRCWDRPGALPDTSTGHCWQWLCGCAAIVLCLPLAQAQEVPDGAMAAPMPDRQADGEPANAAAPLEHRWLARRAPGEERILPPRTTAIMVGGSLAIAAYGRSKWWRDGFNGRFRSVDEDFFGQDTYSGGADKLGHFYMNYVGTRLFAKLFEWDGNAPARALQLAAVYTLGTFAAVEVIDGFSRKWRFSKEDLLMNAAGVGAALLMESNPRLDRLLDLRFQYRPSDEGGQGADPFGDYSGQTYLVVAKAAAVPALREHPVLRYAELAVGYGTRGYTAASHWPRSRNVYVGVSLNLSELLNVTVFKDAPAARWFTRTALEFVQVPGTAALARHTLGRD
jgi:hypothetical protein